MCLIIHVKKGIDKTNKFIEESIRKAAEFNRDGMGYILKREDNSLFINKGFFDVDKFINKIKEEDIKLNDEITIHLRIGNKGETSAKMCHPFIVSNDDDEIHKVLGGRINKPALMHNGTMYKHAVANSNLSDTYYFTKNVLSKKPVLDFMKADSKLFTTIMQPHLCESRLAVVFPDETESILIGKWHDINGILFSKNYNEEYFPKKEISFSRNYYDKNYDDWREKWEDDYDDDYPFKGIMSSIDYNFNDVVDIPKVSEKRPSFVNSLGIEYELYMGLFLPREEDFNDYVVDIDDANCQDVILSVIKADYTIGVMKGYTYSVYFTTSSSIVVSSTNLDYFDIEIPKDYFYELFSVNLSGYNLDYYNEYYKLVKSIPASKSFYKKLESAIAVTEINNKDKVVFHYATDKYEVDYMLALDFYNKMKEELKIQKDPALLLF